MTKGGLHLLHFRGVAAAMMLIVAATTTTACSAGGGASAHTAGSSAAPTAHKKCSGTFGDVVASDAVTDDRGPYCSVRINPDAAALIDSAKLDQVSLSQYQVSQADAVAAQKKAVTFVGDHWVDSPFLESVTADTANTDAVTTSKWQSWVKENQDWFDPTSARNDFLTYTPFKSQIVLTGVLPHALIHDGKPRVSNVAITVKAVLAKPTDGGRTMIAVQLGVNAVYRASDEDTVKWSITVDGKSETDLRQNSPELFDGTGENALVYDGAVSIGYDSESGLIDGWNSKGNLEYTKG